MSVRVEWTDTGNAFARMIEPGGRAADGQRAPDPEAWILQISGDNGFAIWGDLDALYEFTKRLHEKVANKCCVELLASPDPGSKT